MPEYLILKLEGDDPRNASIAAHVVFDGEAQDAIRQGFHGGGRYVALNWDERVEADLQPGPIQVLAVEDKAARDEAEVAERTTEKGAVK